MRNLKSILAFLAVATFLTAPIWFGWFPAEAENAVGPTNVIICNKSAPITTAAAGTQQGIAGTAGTAIQLCGWEVTSGQNTVTTFQFTYGTGATCTTPTIITPPLNITSAAPSVDRLTNSWFSVPTGLSVCLVSTGGAVTLGSILYYAQY